MLCVLTPTQPTRERKDCMITVREATDRDSGDLDVIHEVLLPPDASALCPFTLDVELILYVREGALAYEDSRGHRCLIHTDEFHCITIGDALRRKPANASKISSARVFQVRLGPAAQSALRSHQTHQRFSATERRSGLRVIASPDGRRGSMPIAHDVLLYSALLGSGQHVVHELGQGRSAWLHIVDGQARLGDIMLTTGDAASFNGEHSVSITSRSADTEILLVDRGAA
jgi:redox-sensitive bicupin YhaK (pirin superfamily)